jgi:hypothetical protein
LFERESARREEERRFLERKKKSEFFSSLLKISKEKTFDGGASIPFPPQI